MDCFHLLLIIILLGINIDVQVFCGCMYALLSGISLGVEVLGHVVSAPCLLLTEPAAEVYIPAAVHKGYKLSTISTSYCLHGHSKDLKPYHSHCDNDLHFTEIQ